jgi:hypothetical protein
LLAAPVLADTTLDGSATPSPPGVPTRDDPVLVISFPDAIPMHNFAITSDGEHYFTINGGNATSGQINTYDLNGGFIQSVPAYIDARAILYNADDGEVYVKTYLYDWYRVDPWTGMTQLVLPGIFSWSQSSPGITCDGLVILEHESGTLRFLDSATGSPLGGLSGLYAGGYPSNEAVACDGERIFTWDGYLVQVYDMLGTPIESFNIPNGHYGFSLGWANGLLFTSDDGGGGTGTWYGYDVGAGGSAVEVSTWGTIKDLFK